MASMVDLAPALERAFLAAGVDAQRITRARIHAARMRSTTGAALVELGDLTEEALTHALSAAFRLPAWDGRVSEPLAEHFTEFPCRDDLFVPIARSGDRILIASAGPTDERVMDRVRNISGAAHVDIVVAADAAIVRAIEALFPHPSARELERLASDIQAVDGLELAHVLLTGSTRTNMSGVRVELGREPRISCEIDGEWTVPPWTTSFSRKSIGGVATRILEMAELTDRPAPAQGNFQLIVVRARHGGKCAAFEALHTRTTNGIVVLARRVALRVSSDGAIETDGRHDEAHQQFMAGQWLRAASIFEAIAADADALSSLAALDARSSALICMRLGGELARAAKLAERVIADGERLLGATDIFGADALYELALGQLASGDLEGAAASSARLDGLAIVLGDWVAVMAPHLRGLLAVARADSASALAAFSEAASLAVPFTTVPLLTVSVLHDLAVVLGQLGRHAEAEKLLERAAREARDVPAALPARIAVERALATMRTRHPYR